MRARPAGSSTPVWSIRATGPIYRVRWMTRDGRRVDYLIDAATGAILSGS